MDIKKRTEANPPSRSRRLLFAQIIEMTGLEEDTVLELISLEWVSPATTGDGHYLFGTRDLYRLSKLSRLCRDLEITAAGGSIIVDLLERVEQLEARVEEMRKLI
ncbi:MerR HTH family regulatory protein [Maridesulfovibrio ferrireducens]|uniref:MerR HTH family regulatory protein n=1 Tax=Maridesulfovibrio ferrireducens TaxID=246191 RepID=A0A1G9EC13_9BACT|nr:chaperone modulator CbpM [Maridesulfovibrio ferrireducens]SDK73618.1 MerR HTH family regulatory protein [Maridesulfovibrio ferrireducens]